jgi:hypothetical protein
MAKWKRGGRCGADARTLAYVDYVQGNALPLGSLPCRSLANMSAAGKGAVMLSQENSEEASVIDDDAVDSSENTD